MPTNDVKKEQRVAKFPIKKDKNNSLDRIEYNLDALKRFSNLIDTISDGELNESKKNIL
jgi:hypothetical protein